MLKRFTSALPLLLNLIFGNAWATNESYKAAILNENTRPSYEAVLGRECVKGIIALYNKSEGMSSKYIQNNSRPISDYSRKLTKGYPLYHYTNADFIAQNFFPKISDRAAAHKRLKRNDSNFSYSNLLSYHRQGALRGEPLDMKAWGNTENTVLYVASNPYTSANYGKNLLTFWMSNSTRVLPYNIVMSNVSEEIIKYDSKFSKFLKNCGSGVKLIIYEESGVDLVDYNSGISPQAGWFYLVSTKNIIQSDVLLMKESGPTLQQDFDNDYLRVNSYLKRSGRTEEISR